MKKTIKVLLVVVILAFIFTYSKNQSNKFYKQLEDVILHQMIEIKNNFENKNLLEGNIVSLDVRDEDRYIPRGGKPIPYRSSFIYQKTVKVYDIMINFKNKSGYELTIYNNCDYNYIQNNESMPLLFTKDYSTDRYNANNQLINKCLSISDKINFKYKHKYMEIPIEMKLYVTMNVDKKSIKEVTVDNIEVSIDKDNEILEREIASMCGRYHVEKYTQSIHILLKDNKDYLDKKYY